MTGVSVVVIKRQHNLARPCCVGQAYAEESTSTAHVLAHGSNAQAVIGDTGQAVHTINCSAVLTCWSCKPCLFAASSWGDCWLKPDS